MNNEFEKLKLFVNKELGKTEWLTVDQEMVNKFADATFDHQWIHTDVEKAKQVFPDTGTIMHGFYTLSLSSKFIHEVLVNVKEKVKSWPSLNKTTKINYGCNKVRFLSKVPVGTPIRGSLKILSVDTQAQYVDVVYQVTVEVDGQEKPAMVSENIIRHFY